MYYSMIGLLAILILFIVNHDILWNPKMSYEKAAWSVYRRFLFAVLAYYILDSLWGILESQKLSLLLFADTTLYFVAMAIGVSFWADFTVAYLDEYHPAGHHLIYAGRIIAAIITLLSAINIFVPVLFTIDEEGVYHALTTRYVILAIQILLLLVISYYAFSSMVRQKDKTENALRYRTLGSFGLIMALFLSAQFLFPYLPLYTMAYMLGTSLLHSFVAIDEKEDYKRGLEEAEKITELKDTIISLLNNMPGMTFSKDAVTGVYLACNQAFAEYAHKNTPDDVAGHTDDELFDPETAAKFAADDKIALSMSRPYIFYEDVLDAAGNQRQLQTTKLKYKDISDRLCVLSMSQDITDMVRIEHENAMTKEAYENAVSNSLIYTHIAQTLSQDYTDLFYVNTDSEEFIEYQRDNDSGKLTELRRGWHFFSDCKIDLSEKVYADDRDAFLAAMNRKSLMKALTQKNTFIMTYRQISEYGPVYVSMKISRMQDDDQFIIAGIMNVNAEMRDAMAKSEALAEALSCAEQANRAKTTFLSSMSHEIRTPMNAIIGLDTLALKNDKLDPDTREYLEKIGGSAKHLLTLINSILDISRIESGRVALSKEIFSLNTMIDQINSMVLSQCKDKGLTYECQILNQFDDSFIGDDMRLKEVLINILSNAIKFTNAPGSITLTVERTATFSDQSTIRFCIRDTGIGMDKEYIPKIFDPFSQEDSSHKTRYGSTGLGMAITKGIVDMMNGSIHVESEKGVGTEFAVTVPLKNSTQKTSDQDDTITPDSLYILVVDDNPIEAEHARSVLNEVGIQTDSCTSGQEALRMMDVAHTKHKPYNLVLMDWNMPGMNGLETSAEIQKLYDTESTVVVLTAYDWDDIQKEAHRVGVDNFLAKPLNAANVIEQFERIARRGNTSISKEKNRADLMGRRILLAEDIEINAEIMIDTLEMENIKVDHAENGRIAVEMFESKPAGTYAAILMDVRMPEMDGLEATEAIRALDREDAKQIPIIALTANAFDEDVQRSLKAGMTAHLSKPVEPDRLIRILSELVYEAE